MAEKRSLKIKKADPKDVKKILEESCVMMQVATHPKKCMCQLCIRFRAFKERAHAEQKRNRQMHMMPVGFRFDSNARP